MQKSKLVKNSLGIAALAMVVIGGFVGILISRTSFGAKYTIVCVSVMFLGFILSLIWDIMDRRERLTAPKLTVMRK